MHMERFTTIEKLKDTLSGEQKEYYDAIVWYHYGARQTGRSYLTAVATIIMAIQNPNVQVEIRNHTSYHYSLNFMIGLIEDILKRHNIREHFKIDIYLRHPKIKFVMDDIRMEIKTDIRVITGLTEKTKRLERKLRLLHDCFDFDDCPRCDGVIVRGWRCLECGYDESVNDE